MFHAETALDEEALIAHLCDRDREIRGQHLAMAVGRSHAFTSTWLT